MAKTLVALFNQLSDAQSAIRDLVSAGVNRSRISLVANDVAGEYSQYTTTESRTTTTTTTTDGNDRGFFGGLMNNLFGDLDEVKTADVRGVGTTVTSGPLANYSNDIVSGLGKIGLDSDEAASFAEGLRRGGVIVAVETEESMLDQAQEILVRYNVADIEGYVENWKQQGYSGFNVETAQPLSATEVREYRDNIIPVIEEQLKIGKRNVERGGVRVRSTVEEIPVEEQVTLREEKVTIERRPVDREATSADITDLRDRTIEMTESAEEAVVSKTARVVEEVVVGKTQTEHTETIRDSVKRTDVDVEQIAGTNTTSSTTYGDYTTYSTNFRTDYDTRYANSGYTYEQYEPAYRYGYTYATDARYADRDWDVVETDLRRDWETNYKDTPWENFKDAIRNAWDTVRGKRTSTR